MRHPLPRWRSPPPPRFLRCFTLQRTTRFSQPVKRPHSGSSSTMTQTCSPKRPFPPRNPIGARKSPPCRYAGRSAIWENIYSRLPGSSGGGTYRSFHRAFSLTRVVQSGQSHSLCTALQGTLDKMLVFLDGELPRIRTVYLPG